MSNIEWTEKTWNPTTGCDKVSPGCTNCYAMHMAWRLSHNPKIMQRYAGTVEKHGSKVNWTGRVNLIHEVLNMPLEIEKPTMFFVDSMSDLFHKEIPFEYIYDVFRVMTSASWHTFQVLTKRPERLLEFYAYYCQRKRADLMELPASTEIWFAKNIWLGVSVENQKAADERIPLLAQVPVEIRFLSCEPLLEEINILELIREKIKWVIVGGESGHRKRPFNAAWARFIRNDCDVAGVAFFMKQIDKVQPVPADLMIREFPKLV